ncbi:MAG TPA: polyprenyl synthetase family protein [Polyangiaceae bacterium]
MADTDFHAQLAHYSALVRPVMLDAVPTSGASRYLYEPVRDFLGQHGKGLRPALCIATCKAFGGDEKAALPTAAALELLHNALLVHDDIEDESLERRGQPTLHEKYGVPIALNIGDAMNALVLRVLMRNLPGLGPSLSWKIVEEFNHLLLESLEGQALELGWIRDNAYDVNEGDYLTMILKKTCWYSFIHPCRLGALIAGQQHLERFHPFAFLAGAAFQIQDDVLNLNSRAGGYGKESCGDLWEGKRTLILARAFERMSSAERGRFQRVLAKPRSGRLARDVDWMRSVLDQNGSIRYAQQVAAELARRARDEFDQAYASAQEGPDKRFLRQFADFMVERTT